jgi:hypothetical protein
MLVAAAVALAAVVVGNIVLLPRYGPVAAAYSCAFAGVLYCVLIAALARALGCGLATGREAAPRSDAATHA